jgi:hypothetical protein
MSTKTVRRLVFVAVVLIVWGPPALRLAGRELDAALANPFALDPAAILQVGAWVFAGALAALLVLLHAARPTRFFSDLLADRPVRWYLLYGLAGVASLTYSNSPVYTAFFVQKILVGVLLLALLEWHWPTRRGSRALQVLFGVYILQSAAIAILYFVDRRWITPFAAGADGGPVRITGGVFADYGASGLLAGIFFLSVALFGATSIQRMLGWAAYGFSWWLVVISQTRATMAAAVVVMLIMLHSHPRARLTGALIVTGVGIGIVTLRPSMVQEIVSVGTRRGEGLDTLSGRTEAFAYLMGKWQESPLFGYGFASGTRNLLTDFVARERLNIGAGHDALSTVLVDLGLFGLVFLATALAAAWIAAVRLYRAAPPGSHVYLGAHQVASILAWVTLHAIVDKSLAGPYLIFMVALVAMWVLRKQLPARRLEPAQSSPPEPLSEPDDLAGPLGVDGLAAGRRAHP